MPAETPGRGDFDDDVSDYYSLRMQFFFLTLKNSRFSRSVSKSTTRLETLLKAIIPPEVHDKLRVSTVPNMADDLVD